METGMMTEQTVIQCIKECLGFHVSVTPETTRAELSMDSLDEVELVMALEEELGIEIYDHEAETWNTVGDVIRWIDQKPLAT
jgi:acyl carrier protein